MTENEQDEGGVCGPDCLDYLGCHTKKPYNWVGRYCPWKQNKKEGTQK